MSNRQRNYPAQRRPTLGEYAKLTHQATQMLPFELRQRIAEEVLTRTLVPDEGETWRHKEILEDTEPLLDPNTWNKLAPGEEPQDYVREGDPLLGLDRALQDAEDLMVESTERLQEGLAQNVHSPDHR